MQSAYLLESSEILASLRELSLLHTLSNVPVHESALAVTSPNQKAESALIRAHSQGKSNSRVEKIELVVEVGPGASDGGGVGEHAETARDLGEISAGDKSRGLVADSELESSGAPVDELDGAL